MAVKKPKAKGLKSILGVNVLRLQDNDRVVVKLDKSVKPREMQQILIMLKRFLGDKVAVTRCVKDIRKNNASYNMEVAKQLIYSCAAELYHGMDGLSNKEIGDKLMDIIKEIDKM